MDRPTISGGAAASPAADSAPPSPPAAPTRPAPAAVPVSRDALFARKHPLTTDVTVEGYGTVRLASLTQGQWEDLNERHKGEDGKTDTEHGYMNEVVAAALIGPDDEYMFPNCIEGAKVVRDLGIAVVAQLFQGVAGRSGLMQEARDAIVKPSEPTPSGGG